MLARRLFAAALAVILLWPAAAAHAQSYPSKPIRFVLPFGPGSASDALARIITHDISPALGQPIVIVHKPGADGSLAAIEVKRSAADGYTYLFGTNSPFSVVPNIRKEPPYDVMADFTPVTFLGETTFFLVVPQSVPAKTMAEFVSHAKANPKKLNYGSGNTFAIVATALIAQSAGLEMQHIPYKTEPEAILDLLSGQLHLMAVTPTTAVPHVKDGKLKALATTLHERSALLPDVPSITEVGFTKLPIGPWFALAGPAGMAPDVVAVMNKAIADAFAKPAVREQLIRQGLMPRATTPQELSAYFKTQLADWKAALKTAGIEPQ